MDNKTDKATGKIYFYLEQEDQKIDPKIAKIEKQMGDLSDKIELLIPPDEYKIYVDIILKQEKLKWERDFLEFTKIYKGAFKEGLLMGIDIEI